MKTKPLASLVFSCAFSFGLLGAAFAQAPAGVPSMAAAKAAADKGQADTAAAKADGNAKAKQAGTAAKSLLDLNTAPEGDIAALPGVGPDNAKKIVAARPFARKDQLVSKKLLTKDDYAKVKDLVIAKQPAKTPAAKK